MSLHTILKYHFLRKVVMLNCLLLVGVGKIANWVQVLLLKRNELAEVKNKPDRNRNTAERKGENRKK